MRLVATLAAILILAVGAGVVVARGSARVSGREGKGVVRWE